MFSWAHRSLENRSGWLGFAGGLCELSWRSGVETRLLLWRGVGPAKKDGSRERNEAQVAAPLMLASGALEGTSKNKSVVRGKAWKSSILERMSQHMNSSRKEILNTSIECV